MMYYKSNTIIKYKKGFSFAEALITLMVVSVMMAATLPVMTVKKKNIVSGPGTLGGSNKSVQYNDSGYLAGDDNFTYDSSTSRLTVTGGGCHHNTNYH